MYTSLVLSSLVPLALAAVAPRESACTDVHIFLAKGNNEPYPGRQGKLAGAICAGLSSCDYEDILFYNPVESDYCSSISEGVTNGNAQVAAYAKRCPNSKLVLSGYSQGSHIIGDLLAGGGGTFFNGCTTPSTAALDPSTVPGKNIVAVTIWGDVRHTANQPYNTFSGASKDGVFPRSGDMLTNMAKFASVTQSYCVEEDPVCALGGNVSDHLNYFDLYSNVGAGFVIGKVKDAEASSSTTSSLLSSSTSVAASTTTEASSTTAAAATTESSSAASTAESAVSTSESAASATESTTSAASTAKGSFPITNSTSTSTSLSSVPSGMTSVVTVHPTTATSTSADADATATSIASGASSLGFSVSAVLAAAALLML